jgi:hypothetical protein
VVYSTVPIPPGTADRGRIVIRHELHPRPVPDRSSPPREVGVRVIGKADDEYGGLCIMYLGFVFFMETRYCCVVLCCTALHAAAPPVCPFALAAWSDPAVLTGRAESCRRASSRGRSKRANKATTADVSDDGKNLSKRVQQFDSPVP